MKKHCLNNRYNVNLQMFIFNPCFVVNQIICTNSVAVKLGLMFDRVGQKMFSY